MEIKALTQLTDQQIRDIRQLTAACEIHDGISGQVFLDNSMNFSRNIKSNFLLYEQDRLVSFLNLFMPTMDDAEVTAFTQPEERGKGHFKRLLVAAIEEIRSYDIPDIIFVCDNRSQIGKAVVENYGATYEMTEYFMRYDRSKSESFSDVERPLDLVKASIDDLTLLTDLNHLTFEEDYDNARLMTENILKAENKTYYLAKLQDQTIGMAAVSFENQMATLFGVGIKPEFKGKGYGKALVVQVLETLMAKGISDITIEVDSDNKVAYNLYKKVGFKIDVAYSYYIKPLRFIID